jgi:hypothetical protein
MPNYNVIANVSDELLKLLKEKMVPEPIKEPDSIKLITPSEKNADFEVGLYLYDVQELREFKRTELIRTGKNQAMFPGRPLNLFYILYLNSKSQIKGDALKEQETIGLAIQTLMDNPILSPVTNDGNDEGAAITFLTLSFEDKTKLWQVLSMPYQMAVYFSVTPVMMPSNRVYDFTQVLKADFDVKHKEREGDSNR